MTDEKTGGSPPSSGMSTLGRLGRFSMFFITAGFAYPNVFVENVNVTKLDAQHQMDAAKR
jgi:hypothetical protein